MEKFIIFDSDRSLASIGSPEKVTEMTGGIPSIPCTQGVPQIQTVLAKLYKEEVRTTIQQPLGIEIPEVYYTPLIAKDIELTGLVWDTISHTFRQDMRRLETLRQQKQLEMQDWGWLDRNYNRTISMLCKLPCWIIVNSHITYDKDQSTGNFVYHPVLKGGTKDNFNEYFDVVLYTIVSNDKKAYRWQTRADNSRFAKDRLNILPEPYMPQDFNMVINAYRKLGYPYPKIAVIGQSGTGKTKAISTINKG